MASEKGGGDGSVISPELFGICDRIAVSVRGFVSERLRVDE